VADVGGGEPAPAPPPPLELAMGYSDTSCKK